MKKASKYFLGKKNFKRLCKNHESNKKSGFSREVQKVDFQKIGEFSNFYKVHKFICKGQSFLWHQMRYFMALLKAVGRGIFEPEIVLEILDQNSKIEFFLTMEDPHGLVLWDCEYAFGHFPGVEIIEEQFLRDFFSFWYEREFLRFALLDQVRGMFEERFGEVRLEVGEEGKGVCLKRLKMS